MTKIIVSALVVIAVLVAAYLLVFSSKNQTSNPSVTQVKPKITKVEPTPDVSGVTSDEAIEDDITALERELAEIEKGDSLFSKDLQGL